MLRVIAVGLCPIAVLPASALAAETGGASLPGPPRVSSASCATSSAWTCAAGERLTLRGASLDDVSSVVFLGGRGRADDLTTRPARVTGRAVVVRVPDAARAGPLRLTRASGADSVRTPRLQLRTSRAAPAEDGTALGRANFKLFAGSRKQAVFPYRADGARGGTVEAVNLDTGAVVRSWPATPDASGGGEVRWDGTANGVPVPTGRYSFRVAGHASSAAAEPGAGEPFTVYSHLFPIRGRHDLGQTATNSFGGGRSHQGQDMFANCGTPLAAATGGRVKFAGTEARAGNYVVIQGNDGRGYVYMHMRDVPLVRTGDLVFTGQRVGVVGETGRASGCHLHFELWTSPGWYEGGTAIDPLPSLRSWDSYS